jgi:hypothetical protein
VAARRFYCEMQISVVTKQEAFLDDIFKNERRMVEWNRLLFLGSV